MVLARRAATMAIQPAKLISRRAHLVPGQLLVQELFFKVPKDYAKPEDGTLTLFGRSVTKYERPIAGSPSPDQKPYFVYFEGGPGMGNKDPQDMNPTRFILNRGYQMLYLDYRGTGLSTPVNADHLQTLGGPQAQADYLKLFRADSIVRDLEAVRLCLTADFPEDRQQWSSLGQSYGGFVTMTYLSLYPQGLRECFLTGGLAPVKSTAEDVYRATWKKVIQRNQDYYAKFPEDVARVHQVVNHIVEKGGVALPSGGTLTAARLLTMGISFGMHGGLDSVHTTILKAAADLDQFGVLTRPTLASLEHQPGFDLAPIYAILHEPLYCSSGMASNWAALRVGQELGRFPWLTAEPASTRDDAAAQQEPLYFSGEMVFPFVFGGAYPELHPMREAAELLAAFDGWPDLYDEAQLRRNRVPVYAASFIEDMFVDFGLARETAALLGAVRVFETNVMYHNALRAHTDEVLAQLFRLRDDTID